MAYDQAEIKTFPGLFLQPNSLTVPDGAMERALNIVINDDNVIAKCRGFYSYYNAGVGLLNNLTVYRDRLFGLFTSKISYFADTGSSPSQTGSITDLTGATVAITAPRRSRTLEQSGNLYWTTDNGVLKIDDYNAKVFSSGIPPALDLRGLFDSSNGVIDGGNIVGYRVVFGRQDVNGNTLLGVPSDIIVLSNASVPQMSYTSSGAGPYTVTVTDPSGHNLTTGMSVTISDATDTDANGVVTVTVTGATTFTYSRPSDPTSGTLTYAASRAPILEFSVPSEISTVADKYFYQVYRTSQSTTDPLADFRLISQEYLTADQISSHIVFFTDTIDDILVTFAAELYTNPNSREGELQANTRAPLCDDMVLFSDMALYANCTYRAALDLDVIDSSSTVMNTGDYIETLVGPLATGTIRRYVGQEGVGNANVAAESASSVGTLVTVNYTAHQFLTGYTIYVSNAKGTGTLPSGPYTITVTTPDQFTFVAAVAPTTVTGLDFQGVTNGTYPIFLIDQSASAAVRLRNTARGIVKAINRDSGSLIYANYVSGITDTPGQMRFTAKGFTGTISVRASNPTTATGFSPQLPSSFAAGDQVFSVGEERPHVLAVSKLFESEAVPLINEVAVGSRNKEIYRVIALRDSVIVWKADGVWKVTGQSPSTLVATLLDNTVLLVASDSVVLLNNRSYGLTNQGIVAVTDNAVEIVSRRIENIIEPILGLADLPAQTAALAYESDRTYRLSTIAPNDSVKSITYTYNTINDTWTETDYLHDSGVVGPKNTLFTVSPSGVLMRERKTSSRYDYCGQNYPVTVVSVASDAMTAVIASVQPPLSGWLLVKNGVVSRVRSVASAGADYQLTFFAPTNLAAADALDIFASIRSNWRFAPFHAGMVGRTKQFSQLQLHPRQASITRITADFANQLFGGSELTEWLAIDVTSASSGWGNQPWGFSPWGDASGVNSIYTTQPGPIVRLWVTQFAQRAAWIQPILTHDEAGEDIQIQALSWSVRAYAERLTK